MVELMQVITIIINIYISFTEKTKRIYIATFLLNLAQLFMYLFNNDLTTTLIYCVITVRSIFCVYKNKFKTDLIPYLIINIQLIVGYFTMENSIQLISILIPCYSCWYLWFYNDTQKIRIGNIIANTAWLIYNLCTGLYIILIMRIITIVSNLVAYIRRKNILLKLQYVRNYVEEKS